MWNIGKIELFNHVIYFTLEFCIKDWWFGLYWNNEYVDEIVLDEYYSEIMLRKLDVYFIVIPTLPLHLSFRERIETMANINIRDMEREYKKRFKKMLGE